MEQASSMAAMDPETEFLASKKQNGNEWELYKENVRPLKRGRNVDLLNEALRSQTDNSLKKSLRENRRRLIEAIEAYKGEDPLRPWIDCIKWVQESFPTGGECSGLVVIYEQCVRTFWHDEHYKDDLRYLKVWLEYAENCDDAEVIYEFLEANQIGQTHSAYYSAYALLMESKNKFRKADDIFNLGIARKAKPLEKLEAAYKRFLVQSTRKKTVNEDNAVDNNMPNRSFGTVLPSGGARRQPLENLENSLFRKNVKLQRTAINKPLSIYNDENSASRRQPENQKSNGSSWHTLGSRADRNKENTSAPTVWSSYKVPHKTGTGAVPIPSSMRIEVFVDEESAEGEQAVAITKSPKPSILQLRKANSKNLKKETELLRENPLRNFPR
ncbi:uncharacterized protein A4U43_C01F1880 [Asparagus officinalis]|uniref:BUB1 N-terminal domain-containing protein n=1 Tax=Asparagus officinalis TaxID=4686 RepID=A0A5P1FLN6_ASPOF|nr:mitotic spindle checkpoint protein BUBR1 [Asparagus officinalis]ONK79004.1 uncharacterized protein A4U43_C01F1880 [Asparagus officinalis]